MSGFDAYALAERLQSASEGFVGNAEHRKVCKQAAAKLYALAASIAPQPESAAPDLDDDPFNVANDFLDRPRPSEKVQRGVKGDTPRTDALISDPMTERETTMFLHARRLERELAEQQISWQADVNELAAARRVADELRAAQSATPAYPFKAIGYITNDGCVKWEPEQDPSSQQPGALVYVARIDGPAKREGA